MKSQTSGDSLPKKTGGCGKAFTKVSGGMTKQTAIGGAKGETRGGFTTKKKTQEWAVTQEHQLEGFPAPIVEPGEFRRIPKMGRNSINVRVTENYWRRLDARGR